MSEANERAYEQTKALAELDRANVLPGATDVTAEMQACFDAVNGGAFVAKQEGER